jgi:response regulator RpfG family c-di-GMP phosphodiesterase
MILYLAQVEKNKNSGQLELKLLAYQQNPILWNVLTKSEVLNVPNIKNVKDKMLVLAEINDDKKVINITDAQSWVIKLVQEYLTVGMTPEMLKTEVENLEEWRRDLTLQSQNLAIKIMELKARTEQIQELEEKLKKSLQEQGLSNEL